MSPIISFVSPVYLAPFSFLSPFLSLSLFLFLFLFPPTLFLLRIPLSCHSRQSFATPYTALHPAAFRTRAFKLTDKSSTSFNFLAKGKYSNFQPAFTETLTYTMLYIADMLLSTLSEHSRPTSFMP